MVVDGIGGEKAEAEFVVVSSTQDAVFSGTEDTGPFISKETHIYPVTAVSQVCFLVWMAVTVIIGGWLSQS